MSMRGLIIAWIAIAIILVAFVRASRFESPRSVYLPLATEALPDLCTFRNLFAIDCPGCGMTRSFILTSRFRLADAWTMNPAGTLAFASIVLSIPWRITQWIMLTRGRPIQSTAPLEVGWLTMITLVMMVNWAWKEFA